MKIVDRKTFLQMPAGTVYSKYEPCIFNGLYIKADTGGNDFVCMNIIAPFKHENSDEFIENCKKMEKDIDIPFNFDFYGRDGFFDEDQLFAVYSRKDVEDTIKALQDTLE